MHQRKNDLTKIYIPTPIGDLTAVADREFLHFLGFSQHQDVVEKNSFVLEHVQQELMAYFAGEKMTFQTPLAPIGTSFQKLVWKNLQTIAFGQIASYQEVAKKMGFPKAARAVGRANGANPFLIIVPCHRVVHADQTLGGYSAGIDRKKWLLQFEEKMLRQ